MRPCLRISPLSRTVVSCSSSSTTAFTSSAYFFCGCWARLRSQSGVPAPATAGARNSTRRNRELLIALLRIAALSNPHHCLLFVADLHLTEEILDLCIFRRVDE